MVHGDGFPTCHLYRRHHHGLCKCLSPRPRTGCWSRAPNHRSQWPVHGLKCGNRITGVPTLASISSLIARFVAQEANGAGNESLQKIKQRAAGAHAMNAQVGYSYNVERVCRLNPRHRSHFRSRCYYQGNQNIRKLAQGLPANTKGQRQNLSSDPVVTSLMVANLGIYLSGRFSNAKSKAGAAVPAKGVRAARL